MNLLCHRKLLCSYLLAGYFCSAMGQHSTERKEAPYPWQWQNTQQGWDNRRNLRTANLSSAERKAVYRVSLNAFRHEIWSDNQPQEEWRGIIESTRVQLIDLDGDGVPEVLELGWVGQSSGDGNSAFRILRKDEDTYNILYSGVAERLNIDRRKNPTHPTVVAYLHHSASEGGLGLYRIDQDHRLRNFANYYVEWHDGTFASRPTLTRTATRSLQSSH